MNLNSPQISTGQKLLVYISVGFIISMGFVYYLGSINPKESDLVVPVVNASSGIAEDGNPIRLKIPKINVNAEILWVGVTPSGAMDAPEGPKEAAWYKLGSKPGEIGSSVIDGHFGWKNGTPAVFDNLYKLKIGDKVYIENNLGETLTFVVREIKTYRADADASDIFISSDGLSHLNLITCSGVWNKILKSHSSRLVVFTDKE